MAKVPDDLDAVAARIGQLHDWVIVLDYDGTISEIVDQPDMAHPVDGAVEVIGQVADITDVVILSGRPVSYLRHRLAALPVTLIGGHGAEVEASDGLPPDGVAAARAAPTLDAAVSEVQEVVDPSRGWIIERKSSSVAVHYRAVPQDEASRLLPDVRHLLEQHAADPPGWQLLEGKKVVELLPRTVSKGAAMALIEDWYPTRTPLVIGDDRTDEEAFEAANQRGGVGVLVARRPRRTAARWRVRDPRRVVALLRKLLEQSIPSA